MSANILTDRLEDIKELTVIAALNLGAGALNVGHTQSNSPQAIAAKERLMKTVTGEVLADGTVVLTLDMFASMAVPPLYIGFAACWRLPQLRDAMLQTLRSAAMLDGITFDLRLIVS